MSDELPTATGVRPGGPDSGTEHELLDLAEENIEQATLWGEAWKTLRQNPIFLTGGVIAVLMTLIAFFPGLFAGGVDPRDCDLTDARQWPSAAHWFGTDLQGCDYYANVIHGARISLSIGLLSVLGTMVLAVILGTLAGYFGGLTDSLLSRFTDIFYGVPLLLGAMILLTVTEERSVFTVALALSIFGWMTAMRLVRSSVITVKSADFVAAAQALAATTQQILTRHIMPNAISPVVSFMTIAMGGFIASEATLTFLGIGLQAPEISWGLQINVGQSRFSSAPYLVFFPALFLSLTVMAFMLMGDALRDALDPDRS
ncbi:ABC transporter permease [Micropruina sp.]|uniref:ABC transporter permease n=1 Tax=Micropruina sp. TaxID=2737536 RepID=UPI0039E26D0E